MVDKDHVFEKLVQACPSFFPIWRAHLAQWGNDTLYIAAGEFVEHMLETGVAERDAVFTAVATALEHLFLDGTEYVRDVATLGVLEGVQNVFSNRGMDPEVFGAYLRPAGRRAWGELNRSWGKSDVARVNGST